jgi:hypothetical protein
MHWLGASARQEQVYQGRSTTDVPFFLMFSHQRSLSRKGVIALAIVGEDSIWHPMRIPGMIPGGLVRCS